MEQSGSSPSSEPGDHRFKSYSRFQSKNRTEKQMFHKNKRYRLLTQLEIASLKSDAIQTSLEMKNILSHLILTKRMIQCLVSCSE